MGLTKQYLRYIPGPVLGLVGGQKSNIVFLDIKGVKGKYCAVGACENVLVWDLRTGEKVQYMLHAVSAAPCCSNSLLLILNLQTAYTVMREREKERYHARLSSV